MVLGIIAIMMACTVSAIIAEDSHDADAASNVNELSTSDQDYTWVGHEYQWTYSVITSSSNGGEFSPIYYTYHINWICVSGSAYQTSNNSMTSLHGMNVNGTIGGSQKFYVNMQMIGTATQAGDWYSSMSVTYTKISDSSTTTVLYGTHLSISSGYTYEAVLNYGSYNNGVYSPYTNDTSSVTQATHGATGSHTFTVSNYTPTKTGYTFLGWTTTPGSNTVEYVSGDTVTVNYGSSIGLYSVWQANTNTYFAYLTYSGYKTDYYTMTGTSASGSHAFTITSYKGAHNDGNKQYSIAGWATSQNSTVIAYHSGDSISVAFGSTTTLYPVWTYTTVSYTIDFDANGGTGTVADITDDMNEVITLPSSGFTRSGYSLAGWSSYSVASTVEYTLGGSFTLNRDITLYAVWRVVTAPVASFTYSVNSSNQYAIDFTDTSIGAVVWQWTFGDTVTSTSQNPSHTYQASGSYTVTLTVTNSTQQTNTYSLIVTIGGDPNETYIITFDYGEGSGTISELQGLYLSYLLLPDATYAGHTFTGWYLNGVFVGNCASEYQVAGNVTLTAQYEVGSTEEFNVTFISGNSTIAVQKVTSGGYATAMRGDANRELVGWYDSDGNLFNFSTPITSDLTLTAKYTGGSDTSFPDIGMVGWAIIAAIIIICVGAAIKWLK